MPTPFQLAIVAPDRSVLDEPVQSVIAPGVEGYFGVWAGHAAMIAALKAGIVEYTDMAGTQYSVAIGGGFAEVAATRVTLLADSAERSTEIDVARAERNVEEARKALRGEESKFSPEEATGELEAAMNLIRAAKR